MPTALLFQCPSCATKFAAIEGLRAATVVATRICRRCGERYRVIVRFVKDGTVEGQPAQIHAATLTFLDNRFTRSAK